MKKIIIMVILVANTLLGNCEIKKINAGFNADLTRIGNMMHIAFKDSTKAIEISNNRAPCSINETELAKYDQYYQMDIDLKHSRYQELKSKHGCDYIFDVKGKDLYQLEKSCRGATYFKVQLKITKENQTAYFSQYTDIWVKNNKKKRH